MLRILYAMMFIALCTARVDAAIVASSHLTITSFFIEATPSANLFPDPSPSPLLLSQNVAAGSDSDQFNGSTNSNTIHASQGGATSQAHAFHDGTPLATGPGGAFATQADASVNSGSTDSADASSVFAYTYSFIIDDSTASTQFDIGFQADLLMTLDSDGDPNDFYSFATSAFTVELIGTASGESINLGSLATASSSLTHTLELTGAGQRDYSQTGLLVSETITLNPGSYAINISQTSGAGAVAVPEPTTLAGVAVLSVACVGGALRRRRAND